MSGPTRGATESSTGSWAASRRLARLVRVGIFLAPLVVAWLVIHVVGPALHRPTGGLGIVVWLLQATPVTLSAALVTERSVARFLPLVTILGLSLTFPDQAPSRFGVALRSGTVKQLQARIAQMNDSGLDDDEAVAARQAIELVMLLGRHERLTRGHTERVRAYTDLIGQELGLNEHDRSKLVWAALLHDIGKLTVPAEILNKDGRPTDEEWQCLRAHPAAGEAYLEPLAGWLGEWRFATSQHHERWDGKGYPNGLAREEIALAGRIVAVADAYDVITSKRSYKLSMSSEAARRELVACAGKQFDPAIVRAMLAVSLGRRRGSTPLAWLMQLPGVSNVVGGASAVPAAALASVVGLGGLLSAGALVDPAPTDDLAFVSDAQRDTDLALGPSASSAVPDPPDEPAAADEPEVAGDQINTTTTGSENNGSWTASTTPSGSGGATIPRSVSSTTGHSSATTTTTTVIIITTTATTTTPPVGPTALADVAVAALGSSVDINVLANDLRGSSPIDSATLRIINGPSRGTATVNNGQIRYSAPSLLVGVTSIIYEVCDTSGLCARATVVITIVLT